MAAHFLCPLWAALRPRANSNGALEVSRYTRLMMRPVEDYSAYADDLIAQHGEGMSQLLGREDFLYSPSGFDPSKRIATVNNAKR